MRLVHAGEKMDGSSRTLQSGFIDVLRKGLDQPGVDPDVVNQLSLAVNSATQAVISLMAEQRADYFARALDPEEMKAALAFFESDAGKAFVTAQYGRSSPMGYAEAFNMVRERAAAQFCAKYVCPTKAKQ
jgi:hypothetical protein